MRWLFSAARITRLLVLLAVPLLADGQGRSSHGYEQVPYNGGFTFTRIRYGGDGFRRGRGSAWDHDYPSADINISKIIEYISTIPINVDGTNVFDLDDPGQTTSSSRSARNTRSSARSSIWMTSTSRIPT